MSKIIDLVTAQTVGLNFLNAVKQQEEEIAAEEVVLKTRVSEVNGQ